MQHVLSIDIMIFYLSVCNVQYIGNSNPPFVDTLKINQQFHFNHVHPGPHASNSHKISLRWVQTEELVD